MQGEHRLGVVLRPELLPHLVTDRGAVLRPRRDPHQRGLHLRAATAAEQPADHAGDRDQVGRDEVLRAALVGDRVQVAGQHVLAGAVPGGHAVVDVLVDPGEILQYVVVELRAAGAGRPQPVDLRLQVRLGVRRVAPDALLQFPVALGATGERRQ